MTPRELAPLPGQADMALRRVRERRRRAALLAASTGGALVLLSLVLSSRAPVLAGVEPVPPAVPRTATGSPVPERAAGAVAPRDRDPAGPAGTTPDAARAAGRDRPAASLPRTALNLSGVPGAR